jgi:hypothetical protein
MKRWRTVVLVVLAEASAHAQDIKLHAYLDGRLVDAPAPGSYLDGGYGKTRYGSNNDGLAFGGGAVVITAQPTPALFALADVQLETTNRHALELLEAYLRYRPVSTTRWRWWLQAGEFFPPISLENDGPGWTSPWTITPSAINSWVGEELRTLGAQASVQWRGQVQSLQASAALFRNNDAAGDILAARGWSLTDMAYGLGGRLRSPDATDDDGNREVERYNPFQRIGQHYGWHADLTWRAPGNTRVTVLHWDNRADPSAYNTYSGDERFFAWRTRFWSLGATTQTGPVTWIAQDMRGDTSVEPFAGGYFRTRFQSAFLLAGWNRGAWRPALRVEHFSADDPSQLPGLPTGEHGNAITAALAWRPLTWLRVTGELLRIDSTRYALAALDENPHVRVTQAQVSVRLLY